MRDLEAWPSGRAGRRDHGFESFAEGLGWLRGFFGLSCEDLAALTGLSPRTIRSLEADGRKPRRDTRFLIGRRLQPLFNQKLIYAGYRGVRPFWDPPRHDGASAAAPSGAQASPSEEAKEES